MKYEEVTYATRELDGGEMITIEFIETGETDYVEFVSVDYLSETITVSTDGGTETYEASELSDVTVGYDY
jgi:hypothetical protein